MTLKYDNNHWHELITTIINRIGMDAFIRLSAAVIKEEQPLLAEDMIELTNEYLRGTEEGHSYSGKERDEWKHEAIEAMKLKR